MELLPTTFLSPCASQWSICVEGELERSCARQLALLYISLSQFLVKFGQMATWPIADAAVAGQRSNLSACSVRDSGGRAKNACLLSGVAARTLTNAPQSETRRADPDPAES